MSWVIEQSENTSAVTVNGDTITCTKDGYYGSPVNALYQDPADQNGQYFWQFQFQDFDSESSSNPSVGFTTQQAFKAGWGLKAMKYLGNLSDGSGLLVSSFGDPIKNNDTVGLLLQLTDTDLKVYIFHNNRPLGLAFNIQSPYPKPLYPVASFNSNGTIKISRLQQIPTSLNRENLQFSGIEGDWQISNYSAHPECAGVQFEITRQGENNYHLHSRVVNGLNCGIEYNSSNNNCKPSHVMSTMMLGPPELMNKERLITDLMSNIKTMIVQNNQQLVIETNTGEQVQLQRFTKQGPSAVTQNIFN